MDFSYLEQRKFKALFTKYLSFNSPQEELEGLFFFSDQSNFPLFYPFFLMFLCHPSYSKQ